MPSQNDEQLAKNLLQARREAGLTQRAAAAKLGTTNVTISNHERGATSPDEPALERYSYLYGWSAQELRYGKGPRRVLLQNPPPGAVRVSESKEPSTELSDDLEILASEFELEARKAGADKRDMRFIRMALRSREATEIYHGGYQEPATDAEQRTEMENTIAMLRLWLKGRIKRRKTPKRRS